jgi:hypothetical protein
MIANEATKATRASESRMMRVPIVDNDGTVIGYDYVDARDRGWWPE